MAWTIADFNSGKIATDPGKGWSPDEWVDWYNKYHPQEDSVTPPANPAASPAPPVAPAAGAGAGGGGNDALGAAMSGLKSAADTSATGFSESPAPGSSDPNLGSRLMPILMNQLSQRGRRIY